MLFDYDRLKKKLSEQIDFAKLHDLRYGNPKKVIIDLSLIYAQFVFGAYIGIEFFSVPFIVISIILIGTAQHGMTIVAHEAAHGLLFPSKVLNNFIGRWWFAAPVLLPYSLYRIRHLQHHQFASRVEDTKEFYRTDISGLRLPLELAKSLFLLDYFQQVSSVLKRGATDRILSSHGILYDVFSILASQIIISAVFYILTENFLMNYILFWLYPNLSINLLAGKLRSIVEHKPINSECECSDSIYYLNTRSQYTRSVDASLIERILFSKLNFHYHTVHHMYPTISYQNYDKLMTYICTAGNSMNMNNILDKSYFSVLCKIWRRSNNG